MDDFIDLSEETMNRMWWLTKKVATGYGVQPSVVAVARLVEDEVEEALKAHIAKSAEGVVD